MSLFADPSAHSSFLSTYLVRVLAYTAGMVAVLYLTAGMVKIKRDVELPLRDGPKPPATQSSFWKTVWQRFVQPSLQTMATPAKKNDPPASLSTPILTAKQTLPLDPAHTAHVLDSPEGRWLLVTGPTGTQLHALQGANHLDQGNHSSSLGYGSNLKNSNSESAPKIPAFKSSLGVPDGWGRVATRQNQLSC